MTLLGFVTNFGAVASVHTRAARRRGTALADPRGYNAGFSVVSTAVAPIPSATAGSGDANLIGWTLDISACRATSQPVGLGVAANTIITYRVGGWGGTIVRIGVGALTERVSDTVAVARTRVRVADRAIRTVFACTTRANAPTLVIIQVARCHVDIRAHLTQITIGRIGTCCAAETEVVIGVGPV